MGRSARGTTSACRSGREDGPNCTLVRVSRELVLKGGSRQVHVRFTSPRHAKASSTLTSFHEHFADHLTVLMFFCCLLGFLQRRGGLHYNGAFCVALNLYFFHLKGSVFLFGKCHVDPKVIFMILYYYIIDSITL